MSSLSSEQVALQLHDLPEWIFDNNTLKKTYHFEDFSSAISFMVQVAFFCQTLEHYPVWQNHYNLVAVTIGDPTQEMHGRDIQLAKRLETAYQTFVC